MYQQAQAAGADPNMAASSGTNDGEASKPKDDNVVDADYEVVDDDK